MFSGPIATLTSRTSYTIQKTMLDVLQTVKIEGSSANLLEAIVLWNETIDSLNDASFPDNQLLDYLPPSTINWTYIETEWDPTWDMKCSYTDEILIHNVTGTGNGTLYDPISAFSGYKETYDPSWLDTSRFRTQADFVSWTRGIGVNAPFTDIVIFVMILSDSAINDRWATNNETMEVSVSALHLQNVSALNNQWFNLEDQTTWRPTGPVANASYTRFECSVVRKPEVADENLIPWVWTNDTYSITLSYREMWGYPFVLLEGRNVTYPTPTSKELFRFYQAYMVTLGTTYDVSYSPMPISVWMKTVQLSIVFLAFIIVCTALIMGMTIRYLIFLRRHKSKLTEAFVPDGKMEWMIYAAKIAAANAVQEEVEQVQTAKDRVYFHAATFGYSDMDHNPSEGTIRRPSLARVYTKGTSISGPSPRIRESLSRVISNEPGSPPLPPVTVGDDLLSQRGSERQPPVMKSKEILEVRVFATEKEHQFVSRDQSAHSGMTTLHPQTSNKSSTIGTHSPQSCEITSKDASFSHTIALDDASISATTAASDFPNKEV